jgi:diguanylate cyclase (GGDEF)-like protein/PAS domain S-box-containing protein
MTNPNQYAGNDDLTLSTAQALRQQAEEIARGKATPSPEHLAAMAPEKARQILHELRVHQIELELQNEELRRAQVELGAARARYFDLYDLAPVGYCSLSEAGLILEANLTAATLLGTARGALVNLPITRYIQKHDQDRYYLYHKRLVASGEPQACELQMHDLGGAPFWARLQTSITRDADGLSVWRVVLTDISERKQSEARLFLLGNIFSNAREGILITATDGTIIDVNNSFSRITGYQRDEVLGRTPHLLSSGYQQKAFYSAMWQALLENDHWHGEIWNRRKNGERYAIQQTISAVFDVHSNSRQYVALFSDITELKKQEHALEHIAHYDALTTLPNRVQLAEQLKRTMAQTLLRGQRLAVVYLDLDGFKSINDRHGHAAGDLLLIAVASRMKQALREGDTLARIGGDEFVAVLLDLPEGSASAPMLTRLLAAAAQPELIGDAGGTLVLQVTASLGITFYPQTDEVDADQLLRQADQAMYQAKLAGKNRYQVFDTEQDRSIRGHHESLEHIRRALGANQFVLYYQPKVNMRTGAVIGAEALIRWQHPDKGLLPPAVFLPVIEEHPLAIDIGEWVIDTALSQLEAWHSVGLDIPVSVNICARQLQQANFVERLRGLLAAHPQVKPNCLELEVLETSALEDLAQVSQVISACREIGVMFALDDFGTGYSSLTYLKRLSVAQLKIDQSFVRDMLDDPDDLSILEGVLGLAIAFRRQVIAEGVETVEHGKMLLQLGCELAQGYGIARPMPAHEFPGWSAAWRPDVSWRDVSAVSRDDLPVLFARVEHIAWVAALENHLHDKRPAPPSLDHRQCRFGMWLYGEINADRRAQPVLQDIETLHLQVHALAQELLHLKDQGRTPEALARLGELHALRDALLELLEAL